MLGRTRTTAGYYMFYIGGRVFFQISSRAAKIGSAVTGQIYLPQCG
jgi:hypothetical protein